MVTASAWKTSAGAAVRVPVAQAVNLVRQLKAYQDAGCMVVGLAADGDVSLPDLDLATGPLVVVVGSEGKGLSRLVRETCDVTVAIPLAGQVESLNASVAAGVVLAEVARGLDSRAVADRLVVSEHTVHDHVKAVLAKTGTATRQALLARIAGAA